MMLDAGDARVTIDPEHGGRIASLRVGGLELLVRRKDVAGDPMVWGSYPMVPWAGRVRDGRFRFRGIEHQLPRDAPPHAIHGVGYTSAWEVTGPGTLRLALDGSWPFGGEVEQRHELRPRGLTSTLTVTASDQPMPVVLGWHPCFRSVLGRGDRARVALVAASMWERDVAGIPTGRLVPMAPGPWDDCFTGLRSDPRITWPGALEVTLRSAATAWVVYDQDPRMVCVEPQTDAPDAFNREPTVLEPGQRRQIRLIMEWSR
jgi:aldose 1-epimerase